MTFRLEITMDNAAFDDPGELAGILDHVADHVQYSGGLISGDSAPILDSNGNSVGSWVVR